MLGFYEGFPQKPHKTLTLQTYISKRKLQQVIVQTLNKINGVEFNLEEVTQPPTPGCKAILEFGIAESNIFNFLNGEETSRVLEALRKKPLSYMDFFCALRYYKRENGKSFPLKFDYYLIRLIFNSNLVEMQAYHERGPRHVPPEEIINLFINRINKNFSRKVLKTL
ncbi:MAG: hypothetical protein QXV01_02410 [Candidatus Bathyarchaeia archaeon]